MQSCLGKGRVYHLKCEDFLNLSQTLFYSHSPITLHKMEKPIMTKIGHSNSSWHTSTQWKKSRNKNGVSALMFKAHSGEVKSYRVYFLLQGIPENHQDKTLFMAHKEPWSWTETCKLTTHRKRALIQREWKVILPYIRTGRVNPCPNGLRIFL